MSVFGVRLRARWDDARPTSIYSHIISQRMPDNPVYYFARIVPNYRVPVLEALNRRLGGRLVVCSGQSPDSSSLRYLVSETEPSYEEVRLRNWWFWGETFHAQPFRFVFRDFGSPAVVLAEESPRSITLPFLLRYAGRHGAGRVLWGHFSSINRSFDPTNNVRDRYRMELARRVEACACYTSGVADMLRPYIAVEKLFVARNTLDLAPMMAQHEELRAEGRESVRRRLSIPARSRVLVYLGRLIPEKGVDLLLEAYRKLSADSQVVLLVVGDGPERARMESETRRQGLDDVRYLGALFGQDAAPFLFSSDVMVVPGYLGLVINHAFAFGLPVVSMRNPIGTGGHSPEVEYLESGETGVLCDGVTVDDLVRGIKSVLNDRPRYSANAYAYARAHLTLEQMVDGLHAAILHAGGD